MANTIEHVGIVVDNLAKAKAFLGNVMGFQLDENRIFPTEGLRRPSSALGQSKLRRSSVGWLQFLRQGSTSILPSRRIALTPL